VKPVDVSVGWQWIVSCLLCGDGRLWSDCERCFVTWTSDNVH